MLTATVKHPTSPMNAVDALLHHEFGELFRLLKREREARVIVLTGEGKAFSAGGDFGWFPALRDTAALDELRRDAKQMIWDLLDVEVPIVCGLNGAAAGLGASIALLCDVIVMSERAVIIDPHVNVGLVAGDGGAAVWPLLLGPLVFVLRRRRPRRAALVPYPPRCRSPASGGGHDAGMARLSAG